MVLWELIVCMYVCMYVCNVCMYDTVDILHTLGATSRDSGSLSIIFTALSNTDRDEATLLLVVGPAAVFCFLALVDDDDVIIVTGCDLRPLPMLPLCVWRCCSYT